jgi:hypothetical protein
MRMPAARSDCEENRVVNPLQPSVDQEPGAGNTTACDAFQILPALFAIGLLLTQRFKTPIA